MRLMTVSRNSSNFCSSGEVAPSAEEEPTKAHAHDSATIGNIRRMGDPNSDCRALENCRRKPSTAPRNIHGIDCARELSYLVRHANTRRHRIAIIRAEYNGHMTRFRTQASG